MHVWAQSQPPRSRRVHMCVRMCREFAYVLMCVQAPGAVTELKDWHWPSAPLRHTLITSAPTLTHLSLTIRSTQALTDTLLSALLSLAPHVRRVSVSSLQLETADHVDTPWPWEELAVDHVSARELLKLPRPVGGGSGECVVRCGSMGLAMVNEVGQCAYIHDCIASPLFCTL